MANPNNSWRHHNSHRIFRSAQTLSDEGFLLSPSAWAWLSARGKCRAATATHAGGVSLAGEAGGGGRYERRSRGCWCRLCHGSGPRRRFYGKEVKHEPRET